MFEAKPVGVFSRAYELEAQEHLAASLKLAWLKEAGEILVDGQSFKLYREGWMSGAFVLEKDGQEMLRAVKLSAFRSQFDLEIDSRFYSLKRASFFGGTFSVVHQGAVVGTIRRAGLFTQRALIDLPSDWPIPIQAFVFWLVVLLWNRQASAAAASAVTTAATAGS